MSRVDPAQCYGFIGRKPPRPKWQFILMFYAVAVTVIVIFLLMEYYGG